MQFSTFQKNLDNWQGASLIFGVLEEEIDEIKLKFESIVKQIFFAKNPR